MKKSSIAVAALLSTLSMTVAIPAAYAAANTHLAACKGCMGCTGCKGCAGCAGCKGCKGCAGCKGCKGCAGK